MYADKKWKLFMDLDHYDEFGNYIGPELEDEESDTEQPQTYHQQEEEEEEMAIDEPANQIILHEDKKYYPSAEEVFGPDVEAMVEEEDQQLLSVPIIAPIAPEKTLIKEKSLPETTYSKEFLTDLMNFPETIRNIAIVGSLHHGKTSFLDMLISESHSMKWDTEKPTRYTDVHMIERERGVSIKSMPMSLVMQNLKGKSYLCNFMDTPGHLNFSDEVSASLRICDGAILVLDVIDGVTPATEQLIKHLATQKIPLFLVVNKIDRLIIELKIPPIDAYFKIKHAIEQVNSILATFSPLVRLSPEADNVCFSSSRFGFCFSLRSFAMMYAKKSSSPIDIDAFARRLWGDIFFDVEKRNFRKTQTDEASKRSFLHFILEPIYKLHAQVIGEDPKSLGSVLATVGIHMKKSELLSDVKPLLATVCRSFFGDMSSVIEMCVSRIPNPLESSHVKVSQSYTGPTDSKYVAAMNSCDPNGPLMIQIVKFYNAENVESFEAFGRVMSGTIKSNQTVRVLGEGYSPDDEEDMAVHQVSGISIFESRYKVKVTRVPAGNWVLLAGVDSSIIKSATITDNSADEDDPVFIFSPLKFFSQAVMKIAVEPVQPTDLPKMLEGLRKISKSYPILETKVEESGEHILLGPGELYLDSAMHDLRKLYSEIDVKVADPVVKFCETIVETSAMKCSAETPNKKNKITMICEPLEKGIAEDIESKKVDIKWPAKELGRHFMDNYEWDILAARNIWAFGPEESGPNVLINDTLPSETDKKLLFSVKDSIKQGFQWGTREGPLTDEPIRNVKFRILQASIASEPIYRGGGQIIPTSRRVCYSAFLTATPRLLEPVYFVDIQAPSNCISEIYTVLARRRGHVTQDIPKPGSPFYSIRALIPVLDSCGFETDLRTHTQGQAMCQQYFDHWQLVPGDPLDKSIVLRPLEPSPAPHLARDFLIKTRRRKGLSEDVAIAKFFDDDMLIELAKLEGASLI